ncbi:hypothetical protein PIB30_056156, partial [Stylosanthes scabra]|nr:hypothetical protein [Stylosanthes scabra]
MRGIHAYAWTPLVQLAQSVQALTRGWQTRVIILGQGGWHRICVSEPDSVLRPTRCTLDELKNFILRTLGALGRKSVRRVAYRLLNILPPLEYKFKIFWLEGDVHVRAMFELHRRYGPRQVMELLFETRDMVRSEAGPSSAQAAPTGPIAAAPIRIATPDVSVDIDSSSEEGSDEDYQEETDESSDSFDEAVSSHFHTLNLDAMEEEPREGHGGGGDHYINLDGGEEFRVGHRFSCREAVHMAVKNYNIRRAAEYRVLESDQYKYVCRCKQQEAGCPWRVRVAMRTNHGY